MLEVSKVLNHHEIKARVVDLKRIATFRSKRSRTIIIKVSIVRGKRLILSSFAKLRIFERQVFVSRELTPSEARLEIESLKRRKKLIDDGTDRRDGETHSALQCDKYSRHPTKLNCSNALQITSQHDIICLTEA